MFATFQKRFPDVSRETLDKIYAYHRYLKEWGHTHNLMSRRDESVEIFENRHLIDCWRLNMHSLGGKILDIGTGNGLPGVLFALQGAPITLTEINDKKRSFLTYISHKLTLPTTIVGDVYNLDKDYDSIVSRAFSDLKTLVLLQHRVGKPNSKGFYWKGNNYKKELAIAEKHFTFDSCLEGEIHLDTNSILQITNIRPQ